MNHQNITSWLQVIGVFLGIYLAVSELREIRKYNEISLRVRTLHLVDPTTQDELFRAEGFIHQFAHDEKIKLGKDPIHDGNQEVISNMLIIDRLLAKWSILYEGEVVSNEYAKKHMCGSVNNLSNIMASLSKGANFWQVTIDHRLKEDQLWKDCAVDTQK